MPSTAVLLASLAVVSVSSSAVIAAAPDFSGSYTLTGGKGAFMSQGASWTLRVVQTESAIEITKTMDGKQNLNTFQMNGSTGTYTNPGGQKGVGKAQFKDKTLVLDTFVTTRPHPNAPEAKIHTRERWKLSSDSKTLTIRTEVDFPNSPLGAFQLVEPWSEIYTRD